MKITTKRTEKFTVIPNGILADKNLSLRAKGLLCYFLSKPDNYTFYLKNMTKEFKEGRDAIRTTINELVEEKYMIKRRLRNSQGKFSEYEYIVFDEPKHSKLAI